MGAFRLREAVWELTGACCFHCAHCGSSGSRPQEDELSTAECLSVVQELSHLGCRRISLIGGEVFLRPDWEEIVSALNEESIAVTIVSNGFLIDEDLALCLKGLKIQSVALSLDGTEATHDACRMPGSFRKALAALEILAAHDIPASVITTLNSQNVLQLEDLYRQLERRALFAWQLQACNPMGNASHGIVDVNFDFSAVLDFVRAHAQEAPFSLGVADNIGYGSPDDRFLRGNRFGGRSFSGCAAGLSVVGIDCTGNIRGCESLRHDRFIEGNLRDRSLIDIWNDPRSFSYNRNFTPDLLTGLCAACEKGPWYAGGCRSYDFFTTGKLYESSRCALHARSR